MPFAFQRLLHDGDVVGCRCPENRAGDGNLYLLCPGGGVDCGGTASGIAAGAVTGDCRCFWYNRDAD